jgi:hypothetical protein
MRVAIRAEAKLARGERRAASLFSTSGFAMSTRAPAKMAIGAIRLRMESCVLNNMMDLAGLVASEGIGS